MISELTELSRWGLDSSDTGMYADKELYAFFPIDCDVA